MATQRYRASERTDGQVSATSGKSLRATRRPREAAASSESGRATPDLESNPASTSLANDSSAIAAAASVSASSSQTKKASPLDTNSISYSFNEFLAGKPSSINPGQRELAIQALGKPIVVAIEENGLQSQPASVAQAIVDQHPPTYGVTAEIDRLPVEALRKYRTSYKLPIHSSQTFNGYLLDCPVGRKTFSFRYGASGNAYDRSIQALSNISEKEARDNGMDEDSESKRPAMQVPVSSTSHSRVTKRALSAVVKKNFSNQSVRESEVIVDFIYSVRTQGKLLSIQQNAEFLD